MEMMTAVILDKSLIVERELVKILFDEARRHELIELVSRKKIAMYTNNGQQVMAEDLIAAISRGRTSCEECLAG